MSRSRSALAATALVFAGWLVGPPLASACTDTPVLSQACQAGEAGLDAGDAIKENTIDGPLPGATNDEPIAGALGSAAQGIAGAVAEPIFDQIATVTTDAAAWLIGKVTDLIDSTTSPDLLSKGFVAQYGQMAGLAALLAAAMLFLAVIEGLARGDMALLGRVVVVNLPLAFIATSSAYVVVQLLLGVTDQMSHAVAQSTGDNTHQFLRGATEGLSKAGAAGGAAGGPTGAAAGAAGVPVFAVIIAALVSIVAGFLVWIELVMRDAAVYVVSLFLPMALAASIWPRWTGALRRTAELLVAVIASKFVIVSIIALAAGLMAENEGRFEHVIAAAALLLLACFAPLVLMKLVPFAEGAMASAYARRSGGGLALSGLQVASSAQMMRATSRANWDRSSAGQGLQMRATRGGRSEAAVGGAAAAGSGGVAATAASGAATVPVRGSQAAAATLASTAAAGQEGERPDPGPGPSGNDGPPRPAAAQRRESQIAETPPPPSEGAPRPRGSDSGMDDGEKA